ncbi:virulence-associated V antigen [Vibrio sp. AND4]|uniref:virulence-associated V antigen n=1 Tax=Vibrio sp. AND4 TaxID=314289 RepID=UPI00015F0E05|nr:virulence-associated V antigen [Vibrio sp. AND4]EDP58945.1 hypothetical protein AND4_03224 [Vibrio sp. AND4]
MSDMTTMNSLAGVLDTTTNRDSQSSYKKNLVESLSPILNNAGVTQFESLVNQLPMVLGRNEQQSLELYAESLRTLLDKQTVFGTSATDTVAHWMRLLQKQEVNGLIAPQTLTEEVNTTLENQFQSWFSQRLNDRVDSLLPTEFVANFRLGSQATQAQQIDKLDTDALKAAKTDISKFVDELATQANKKDVRESAIPFLRNAFGDLDSVDLNDLKHSDYLLTKESFRTAVSTQFVTSLESAGLTFNPKDVDALADKIVWIPGMSKQDLRGALDDLFKQVKGQYENVREQGKPNGLQEMFAALMTERSNSKEEITLSGFFSTLAFTGVSVQFDLFYNGLESAQKQQMTKKQLEVIKQDIAQEIHSLFEKIAARQDTGTDFVARHLKMTENLSKLEYRLGQSTEKSPLTAHDLLAVVKSSIGDRFDDKVLFALNERRLDRLSEREKCKDKLQELTTRLSIFSEVQSTISSKLSEKTGKNNDAGHYNPDQEFLTFSDFGYENQEAFEKGPEFKYLKENIPSYEDGISHREFLELEGVSVEENDYSNDKDSQSLSNLSSAIASKSKPINDDVQLQTTVLNDISSQYNATVEAMNSFVQKYHSILQEILRAL